MEDRPWGGRKLRMLNVVEAKGSSDRDEYTRECLAIHVGRQLRAADMIDLLSGRFIRRSVPAHGRSDDRPEFAATAVKGWTTGVGARTAFIEPGSPWESGHVESLKGKLRDELINIEVFDTLAKAKVLTEGWRRHYNTVRPHSSLRYRPPVPKVVLMHLGMSPNGQSTSASAQLLAIRQQRPARLTSWGLVTLARTSRVS